MTTARWAVPLLVATAWTPCLRADPRSDLLERIVRAEMPESLPQGRLFTHPARLPTLSGVPQGDPQTRLERLWGGDEDSRRILMAVSPGERATLVELVAAAQRVARRYPGDHGLLRDLDWDGLALVAQYGDAVADGVAWFGGEYKAVVRDHGLRALAFLEDCIRPDPAEFRRSSWEEYRRDPGTFHDHQDAQNIGGRGGQPTGAGGQYARFAAWAVLAAGSGILLLQAFWLCRRFLTSPTVGKEAAPTPTFFRE